MKKTHLKKYCSYFITSQLLLNNFLTVAANSNNSITTDNSLSLINNSNNLSNLTLPVISSGSQFFTNYEATKFELEQGKKHSISIETVQDLYQAQECMQQENYAQAFELFNNVIDEFSLIETKDKQVSQQKIDAAFERLKEYQELLAISHRQIAKIYAIQGNLQEAAANSLIALLYASPLRIEFFSDYLNYLFQLEKYTVMLDFIEKSFTHFPNHPTLLEWQRKVLQQLNHQDDELALKLNWYWPILIAMFAFVFGIIRYCFDRKPPVITTDVKKVKIAKHKTTIKNHGLQVAMNSLIDRLNFYREKVQITSITIKTNEENFADLQREAKIYQNLIKKFLRYSEKKDIEQFKKHLKHFCSLSDAHFYLLENMKADISELEEKITILLSQTTQESLLENHIQFIENSFDFNLRLESSFEHLQQIYQKLELSFQHIEKQYFIVLEQEKLKQKHQNKQLNPAKFHKNNAQNDEDNNDNNMDNVAPII